MTTESTFEMIVLGTGLFMACLVAVNIFNFFISLRRSRKEPTKTTPTTSPINKDHSAWIAAYNYRINSSREQKKEPRKTVGWIYAYTFQSCQRDNQPYPIKVGQTRKSVERRINEQCKGTAAFERPLILGKWESPNPIFDEKSIHRELLKMGCRKTDGSGTEWFHATPEDIEKAVLKVISKNLV